YNKYRGNGDKVGRKLLQHWSFSRIIDQCILKLNENGNKGEKINEWNTSRLHYKCNQRVERPHNSSFQRVYCSRCDDELDAEFNASINIAVKGISQHSDKSIEPESFWQNMAGVTDELTQTMDESGLEARKSIEAHSLGCG
ncbi:MAG: zinc ribbon domain-containing protein, partial [Candidatus Natronoplasma sp.]